MNFLKDTCHARGFTWFDAAKLTSKTYDMTKVAKYDENVIPSWRKSYTL